LEIALTIFYALLFSWLIWRAPFFKDLPYKSPVFIGIFWVKIAVGFILYWIYTNTYQDRFSADIFKYFDDSYHMTKALYTQPLDFFKMLFGVDNKSDFFHTEYYDQMNNWYRVYQSSLYNDSHAIIRVNALIRIFSFGHYHVHTVFMCFFALVGLTAIYKSAILFVQKRDPLLLTIIFLLPSVLLWSSGVLKEAILFFALGLMIYSVFQIFKQDSRKWYWWGLLLFGLLFLLFQVKFYVLAAFVTGAIGFVLVKFTGEKWLLVKYFLALLLMIALGMNYHRLSPEFEVIELITLKQQDLIALGQLKDAGSLFKTEPLEPSIIGLIKGIPEALFHSFLQPLPWQTKGTLQWLAVGENLLILFLIVWMFWKKTSNPIPGHKNAALFFIFSGLLLIIIVGWTTPIAGALVRYKSPGMLALLIGIYIYTNPKIPYLKQ
jgi:hypothetical protein